MASLEQRQMALQADLAAIEQQIYELETSYFEETSSFGNVIKGFEGYLNVKPKPQGGHRKIKISAKERIFSSSSVTAPFNLNEEYKAEKHSMHIESADDSLDSTK